MGASIGRVVRDDGGLDLLSGTVCSTIAVSCGEIRSEEVFSSGTAKPAMYVALITMQQAPRHTRPSAPPKLVSIPLLAVRTLGNASFPAPTAIIGSAIATPDVIRHG
ncbi:hypothetical protein K458DRAFT_407449 [Lentithecium fluviatile CBS 122367]|uniref:Uncharacterized protein n=1 Tax=Lentithecium fluviatile CBS 122367 TaxID=1168545 RepID=A0A6G1IQA1_9PLEO|nr:hypothetical protein K458DRAFT_407449 [Lentithecium fluviatile CBS 122367]